jgi:hypothetical protein
MKAELTHVEAIEKAVNPTLRFTFQVETDAAREVVMSAAGSLYFPSDTLLAPVFEAPEQEQFEFPLQASPATGAFKPTSRWLRMGAQLSHRDIDHIESQRAKDRRGDVVFTVRLRVSTLVSAAESWLADTVPSQNGLSPIVHTKQSTGKAIVREDPQKGFLLERTIAFDKQYKVPGTNWVHDFAPRLGLGRFAVIEVPVLSSPTGLGERMGKAAAAADEAEKALRSGEWDDACRDLRGVWEAFRDFDFIKEVATKDGYTDEAAKLLNDAFKNLFALASKFGHVLDKDRKTVLPELHAKREDAYAFYLLARSALDLIARKAKRLGISG